MGLEIRRNQASIDVGVTTFGFVQIAHGNGQSIVTPLNHSPEPSLYTIMYTIVSIKRSKSLFLLIFNRISGAPERTRTSNPRLRRPMLYPVELQALKKEGILGATQLRIHLPAQR